MHQTEEHPKFNKILEDFKEAIPSNTLILGDFNTLLSKVDWYPSKNINKDIVALNNVLDQMDTAATYGTFHPKETKCIFF